MNENTALRIAVKRTIIDSLNAAMPDVQVLAGWPGDELEAEAMFPGEIVGTLNLPVMMADRKMRDDEFTITWVFRAALPGQTYDDAEDRIAYIAGCLDDACANDSTLGDDTSVESAMTDWKHACGLDAEGVKAYGEATTTHHCRYH